MLFIEQWYAKPKIIKYRVTYKLYIQTGHMRCCFANLFIFKYIIWIWFLKSTQQKYTYAVAITTKFQNYLTVSWSQIYQLKLIKEYHVLATAHLLAWCVFVLHFQFFLYKVAINWICKSQLFQSFFLLVNFIL
jgi:hypothetical protein